MTLAKPPVPFLSELLTQPEIKPTRGYIDGAALPKPKIPHSQLLFTYRRILPTAHLRLS
jgi:hypothetical protein